MALSFRKPEPVPVIFTLCAAAFLVFLGVWQMQRLEWKEGLLARADAAAHEPVLGTLPSDPAAIAALEYRRAAVTGRLIGDKKLRFIGQKSNGYVWIAPLKLEDSDVVIAVKLGWLPSGEEPNIAPGVQTVQGMLQPPREKRLFSPANDPAKNLWFTQDLAEMRRATGLALAPLILDDTRHAARNDHLGYAITWFILAGIAVVMCLVYHRKPNSI